MVFLFVASQEQGCRVRDILTIYEGLVNLNKKIGKTKYLQNW